MALLVILGAPLAYADLLQATKKIVKKYGKRRVRIESFEQSRFPRIYKVFFFFLEGRGIQNPAWCDSSCSFRTHSDHCQSRLVRKRRRKTRNTGSHQVLATFFALCFVQVCSASSSKRARSTSLSPTLRTSVAVSTFVRALLNIYIYRLTQTPSHLT